MIKGKTKTEELSHAEDRHFRWYVFGWLGTREASELLIPVDFMDRTSISSSFRRFERRRSYILIAVASGSSRCTKENDAYLKLERDLRNTRQGMRWNCRDFSEIRAFDGGSIWWWKWWRNKSSSLDVNRYIYCLSYVIYYLEFYLSTCLLIDCAE